MSPIDSLPRSPRFDIVDIARGVALVGMFVFHLGWDVSFLGLADIDPSEDWRWRWLARVVAGSFLTLTGFSLALATRNGFNRQAYLRRLAQIVLAAGLVTLGTWFAVPEAFVKFGILHHIAFASVVGLGLLRWPVVALVAAAGLAFIIPRMVSEGWIKVALFDYPLMAWLGLGSVPPDAVDHVPVFPWLACVFLGMALAKVALARNAIPSGPASNPVTRLLAFGGRHSLAVYLIHQPVFIGLLMGLSLIMPRTELSAADRFTRTCESACISTGMAKDDCKISCNCSKNRITAENLWEKTMTSRLTPAEETRIREIAAICLKTE
jgi:uncharacterized membrane protein